MKIFLQIFLLTIIDFILIWFWVRQMDPDPSVSIGLLVLVPTVFVINIIFAILFVFIKKQYSRLFLINAVISSFLMYFLFIKGIDRHQNRIYEIWKFNLKDTTFKITLSKLDTTFNVAYSTNPGSSTGFINGQYNIKANEYFLTSGSTKLTIKNEFLFGFRNTKDSIKLTKIER